MALDDIERVSATSATASGRKTARIRAVFLVPQSASGAVARDTTGKTNDSFPLERGRPRAGPVRLRGRECTAPLGIFPETRRCPAHRAPGRRVKPIIKEKRLPV